MLNTMNLSLPRSTPTKSGSLAIDLAVANKTAIEPEASKPLNVDSIHTTHIDARNNTLPGMWFLLVNQNDGRNGVYKNSGNGGPWEFVGLLGERITDNKSVWYYNQSLAKWIKEGANEPAIVVAPANGPAAPSTSVPILTMLNEPTIKNTGIVPPNYGATLPEVDIVAEPLTASGLEIKPIYIIGAVVALVVAYFIYKKYGK